MVNDGLSKSHFVIKALESLEHVVSLAEDLIMVMDDRMSLLYLNNTAAQLFGKAPRDLIGKSLSELFPPDTYHNLRWILKQVFHSSKGCSCAESVMFPKQELWLDARFTPILGEDGNSVGALCIARDITLREQKEALITRAKQEWEQAVDGMTLLLAVVNVQFRIARVNSALAQKLGCAVHDAVGMTCYEKLHGTVRPPVYCPLLQPTQGAEEHSAEVCETYLRGSYMVRVSSLGDRQGRLVGCIYVGRPTGKGERASTVSNKRDDQMRLLMQRAEHIVTIQSKDARYLFFNASPQYGLSREDIVGKTPFDFFEPARASAMVEKVVQAATTGQDLTQLTDITFGGETVQFFELISPVRDGAEEEVRSIVTVFRRVTDYRHGTEEPRIPAGGVPGLTQRESEVLRLIAAGLTNRQVGEKLFISVKTVATHRSRIMSKLDLHKTSALVKYAVKIGLLEL